MLLSTVKRKNDSWRVAQPRCRVQVNSQLLHKRQHNSCEPQRGLTTQHNALVLEQQIGRHYKHPNYEREVSAAAAWLHTYWQLQKRRGMPAA
jgi:hypothetical protein